METDLEEKKRALMKQAGITRPAEDIYYIHIKVGASEHQTLIYRYASFYEIKAGFLKDLFCPLCMVDLIFRWKGQILNPYRTPDLYGIRTGAVLEIREVRAPNQSHWLDGSNIYLAPSNLVHPQQLPGQNIEYFHLPDDTRIVDSKSPWEKTTESYLAQQQQTSSSTTFSTQTRLTSPLIKLTTPEPKLTTSLTTTPHTTTPHAATPHTTTSHTTTPHTITPHTTTPHTITPHTITPHTTTSHTTTPSPRIAPSPNLTLEETSSTFDFLTISQSGPLTK